MAKLLSSSKQDKNLFSYSIGLARSECNWYYVFQMMMYYYSTTFGARHLGITMCLTSHHEIPIHCLLRRCCWEPHGYCLNIGVAKVFNLSHGAFDKVSNGYWYGHPIRSARNELKWFVPPTLIYLHPYSQFSIIRICRRRCKLYVKYPRWSSCLWHSWHVAKQNSS